MQITNNYRSENQVKNFYFSNLRKVSKQIVHFQKQYQALLVPQSSKQSKQRNKSQSLNANNLKTNLDKNQITLIMQNVPFIHVFCSQRAVYFMKVIYRIIDPENVHLLDFLDEKYNKSMPKFNCAIVESHRLNEASVISLLRGNDITPKHLLRLIKTVMKKIHHQGLREQLQSEDNKIYQQDSEEQSEERNDQTNQINKDSVCSKKDDNCFQSIQELRKKEHSIESIIKQQSSDLGTLEVQQNKYLNEQYGHISEKHHLHVIYPKRDPDSDDLNQSNKMNNHLTLIKSSEGCIEAFNTFDEKIMSTSSNRLQFSFQLTNINHQEKDATEREAEIQNQQHDQDILLEDDEFCVFGATHRYLIAEVPASTQFVDYKLEQLLKVSIDIIQILQELDEQNILLHDSSQ